MDVRERVLDTKQHVVIRGEISIGEIDKEVAERYNLKVGEVTPMSRLLITK